MEKAYLFKKENLGKRANAEPVEIGKWYQFKYRKIGKRMLCFGKVVDVVDDDVCVVEKYFEVVADNPYRTSKWYDSLPLAVSKN